jgi:hypothetical protein
MVDIALLVEQYGAAAHDAEQAVRALADALLRMSRLEPLVNAAHRGEPGPNQFFGRRGHPPIDGEARLRRLADEMRRHGIPLALGRALTEAALRNVPAETFGMAEARIAARPVPASGPAGRWLGGVKESDGWKEVAGNQKGAA